MSPKFSFERVSIEGQKAQVLDLKPAKYRESSDTPLYFDSGWVADLKLFDEYLRKIHEQGIRVLGVNTPHGIQTEESEVGLSEIEKRKLAGIDWLLQTKRIDMTNIASHSQGALTSTAAIESEPAKFRNAVLFNPAGIIGEDTVPRLIALFGHDAILQGQQVAMHPYRLLRLNLLSLVSIASNLGMSLDEISTIGGANILDRIDRMRAQLHGLKLVATESDKAFPADRIRRSLSAIDPQLLRIEPGTHNAIMFEQSHFAEVTLDILRELEIRD